MRHYFSLSHLTSGFLGMMVGFTSSAVLVFQAANTAGANQAEMGSWLVAIGLGIAITCIGLSLRYRMPILTGWSTPGAALLITSLSGVSMPEAIGAFILSALLTVFVGISGLFEKLVARIPRALSAAMLAGIMMNFGINIFVAMEHQFVLVFVLFLAYLAGKRLFPRYVILLVLCLGVGLASANHLFHFEAIELAFPKPLFTVPTFSLALFMSISMPLFIVSMTSQNIPGITVLKANGYTPPVSPLITWTGLTTLLLAPFGCFGVNLAAITAAICTGKEAGHDPATRYKATLFAGICWLILAAFGATVVALLSAFPQELILAIAGLALLPTLGNSLNTALEEESSRESALITILVAASGASLLGIGSAFWGLLAGFISLAISTARRKQQQDAPELSQTPS